MILVALLSWKKKNKCLEMFKVIILLSLLVCYSHSSQQSATDEDTGISFSFFSGLFDDVSIFEILPKEPDFDMGPAQMIELRGFKAEVHHAVTEDCYVLELHRVVSYQMIQISKSQNI